MSREKVFHIFAGVNGAGKTTLYNLEHIKGHLGERINTDEIVRGIGDWRNSKDQVKAARRAITLKRDFLSKGISFNQETTLTGKTILKSIAESKERGYKIYLYYVGLENPNIAKERIKKRVSLGGHNIPDDIVEKRYFESIENFKNILNLCDKISVYDNTKNFEFCLGIDQGKLIEVTGDIPSWLLDITKFYVKQ